MLTLVKELFLAGGGIPIIKVDGFQLARSVGSELFHSDKPIQALQLEEMDSSLSAAVLWLHPYFALLWLDHMSMKYFPNLCLYKRRKIYICPTYEALTSTANLNQIEKGNKTDLSWGRLHMWHEIYLAVKTLFLSLSHTLDPLPGPDKAQNLFTLAIH